MRIPRFAGMACGPIAWASGAERLGWIASSDVWMAVRRLRNLMVQEHVEDTVALADALQQANDFVPMLRLAAENMRHEVQSRGWAGPTR